MADRYWLAANGAVCFAPQCSWLPVPNGAVGQRQTKRRYGATLWRYSIDAHRQKDDMDPPGTDPRVRIAYGQSRRSFGRSRPSSVSADARGSGVRWLLTGRLASHLHRPDQHDVPIPTTVARGLPPTPTPRGPVRNRLASLRTHRRGNWRPPQVTTASRTGAWIVGTTHHYELPTIWTGANRTRPTHCSHRSANGH